MCQDRGLEAIEKVAKAYKEQFGETLKVRICVTGPTELYLRDLEVHGILISILLPKA